MAAVQRKLVHKQFNSPIGLYSQENVKATLDRELKAFGVDGIEVDDQISKPLNLANSAVLRAVEEEEQAKSGYKRVAWPPVSEERIIREFTPQPQNQQSSGQGQLYSPQHLQSNVSASQQQQLTATVDQQQQQASGAAIATPTAATQPQYRAPSYDPYHQQQQPIVGQYRATPTRVLQTTWPPQQAASQQYQQQQQQQPLATAASGYPQQQQQQQPNQQYPQQQQQPLYNNYQAQNQPQYQIDPSNNLYNSYSQPQQQQQQPFLQSQDQLDRQQSIQPQLSDYRGVSPGIITLRNEAPVTQKPAPVYTSQPAAVSYQGGSNMRGDLKWPPQEYKEAADRENEERRKLALGPVCRPRRVNRDYASFFAKNAISHHYPSYRVPPGTQHMLA